MGDEIEPDASWQDLLRAALADDDEARQIAVLGELGRLLMGVLLKKVPSGTRWSPHSGLTSLDDESIADARRGAKRGAEPMDEDEQPTQVEMLHALERARDSVERGKAVLALVSSNPKLMLNPAVGREIALWHRIIVADAQPDSPVSLTPEFAMSYMDRFMRVLSGAQMPKVVDESALLAQLASTDPKQRGEAAVQLLESSPDYVADPLVCMTIIEWHREIRREYRHERAGPAALSASDARHFLDETMRRFMRSGPPGQGVPDPSDFRLEDLIAIRVVGGVAEWCKRERRRTKEWPRAQVVAEQFDNCSEMVVAALLNERHSTGPGDGVRRRLAPRRAADQFLAERCGVALKTIEAWRRRTDATLRRR